MIAMIKYRLKPLFFKSAIERDLTSSVNSLLLSLEKRKNFKKFSLTWGILFLTKLKKEVKGPWLFASSISPSSQKGVFVSSGASGKIASLFSVSGST